MKAVNIRKPILISLTVAFFIAFGAFLFSVYWTKNKELANYVEKELESVQELFKQELNSDAKLMDAIFDLLSRDRQLQDAWMTRDRALMLEILLPILSQLKVDHQITHLYFHDTDRVNFLRVHKPEKHGDIIDRITMLKAEKSGKIFSGIELGPLGTFTLRMVHPWRINGMLAGYIELGEEIDQIIKKLHEVLGIDFYISIYKEFLNKKAWEDGMRMLGRNGIWDQLDGSVIISHTLKSIPKVFKKYLSRGQHGYMKVSDDIELSMGDQLYRVGVIPLFDAAEREVGDIVVLHNVTGKESNTKMSILFNGVVCIFLGGILLLLFSTILGRVEGELNRHRQHLEGLVKGRTMELTKANVHLKREVTERKSAEEKLKIYSEKLEDMVQKRTKKLRDAQESLVRKEKLATLGQLSGGVGHELRNPLGVISNAVYYLKMVLPDAGENIKEYMDIISAEVDNAERIVSDLLDFSRIKSSDKKAVDISELFARLLEKHPPPEGVRVTTEIASDPPSVYVDPRQMEQVLTNLVTNACQAMPEGGDLIIEVEEVKNKLRISIIDTGCGMSSEDRQKIFEPLFTTKAQGIGLGLSITRNLLANNGGSIEAKSEEGKGSTFTVILPTGKA